MFVCYNYFANEMISNKALQKKNHQENFVKGQPREQTQDIIYLSLICQWLQAMVRKGWLRVERGKGLEKRQPCCCKEGASGNSNSLIAPLIIKDLFPNSTMK